MKQTFQNVTPTAILENYRSPLWLKPGSRSAPLKFRSWHEADLNVLKLIAE